MRKRASFVMVGFLLTLSGAAAQAAWPSDPVCRESMGENGSYIPPECDAESFFVGYFSELRLDNPCQCTSGQACSSHGVTIHYPTGFFGTKFAPAVFLHGGGTGVPMGKLTGHSDDGHGHSVNAYAEIARSLAHVGFVVIEPILPTSQSTLPYGAMSGDAYDAANLVQCVAQMTSSATCTPSDGARPCLSKYGLVDTIAWSPNNKENVVIVGHSAGAVASLYLPKIWGSAVKGVIMLDPAKHQYLEQPPTLTMAGTSTPIFHLYPDWYGPFQNDKNQLFKLGAPSSCRGGVCVGGPIAGSACSSSSSTTTCGSGGYCTDQMGCTGDGDCPGGSCTGPAPTNGPWVPIGIRDYPGCDPDKGCHESHHCSVLTSRPAYDFQTSPDGGAHHAWCHSAVPGCTKFGSNFCPYGKYCSPSTYCSRNGAVNGGHTWTRHRSLDAANAPDATGFGARSSSIYQRYVKAIGGCLGGALLGGAKVQPWVTGWARRLNDSGGAGGVCSDKDGQLTLPCSGYSTRSTCDLQACVWNVGFDTGKVIRINDGELVSEYTTTTARNYTAAEGWDGSGKFVEREERLGSSPRDPYYISCESGPGLVP